MTPLLDSAIKVSVVLLIALGAVALLRGRSAAARHWVLSVGVLLAAAMPLLAAIAPSWQSRTDIVAMFAAARGSASRVAVRTTTDATWAVAGVESSGATSEAPTMTRTLRSRAAARIASLAEGASRALSPGAVRTLGAIWLIGIVISLAFLFTGLARLAWLASRARPMRDGGGGDGDNDSNGGSDSRWTAIATELTGEGEFELRRPVALLHSDHPVLLVTWGLRRPKILLPAGAARWTDARIRIVLSHELAHVRRHDWAMQVTATLLRAVYWFNPLAWIVCRRLRQESEQACDDVVLRCGVEGTEYATHLLELARAAAAHHGVALPAQAIARSTGLERRITAMLNARVNRYVLTRRARVAIAAALSLITLPIAGFDAFAQAGPARLSGTIVDQSGAPVPKASVELTETRTQARQNLLSDDAGRFAFVNLAAGEYGLAVETPGFAASRETVRLAAGQVAEQDVRLRIGRIQETVTVGKGTGTGAADQPERSAESAKAEQSRFGGSIRPPMKIKSANPVYPQALQSAGTTDQIVLDATVGIDGAIKDLKVRSSKVPELANAAMEAVRQWRFIPTLLHGKAVETQIAIAVDFR